MVFSLGFPSSLNDFESVDWAPTVNLGYQKGKPATEASRKREERMKSRVDQHRHAECAEALLDLHESAENPEPEDTSEILLDQQGELLPVF